MRGLDIFESWYTARCVKEDQQGSIKMDTKVIFIAIFLAICVYHSAGKTAVFTPVVSLHYFYQKFVRMSVRISLFESSLSHYLKVLCLWFLHKSLFSSTLVEKGCRISARLVNNLQSESMQFIIRIYIATCHVQLQEVLLDVSFSVLEILLHDLMIV